MINKTRIMLYVDSIETISKFWLDNFDAKLTETNELPNDFQNIILSVSEEVELSLFPKEFIKQFSPEVLDSTPSLMFFVNNFDEKHQQLETAGEIRDNNGVSTFNFADPEGNYFVVAKR